MITHKKTITTLALAALIATSLPAHAFFSLRDAVNSFKKSTLAQVVAGGCALGLGAYLIYKWRYETPKNTPAGSNNNKPQDPTHTISSATSSALISSVSAATSSSSSSSSILSSSSFSSSSSAATLSSATATPHSPTPLTKVVANERQQKQATDLKSAAESRGPVKILSAGNVASNSMPFAVGQFDGKKKGAKHINEDFAYADQQNNIFAVCDGTGSRKEANIQERMLYDELSKQVAIQQIEQQYASTGFSFQEQLDPADAAKAIGTSLCQGIKKAKGDQQAIRTVFDETHHTLFKKLRLGQATAVVAQILDNKLIVAGLGDSYALLFKKDGSVAQLSKDSTPDFCIGAENYNKNQGLHVATHDLSQQDDFMVLMSDGVIWGEDNGALILQIEQKKEENRKRASAINSNKQHHYNKNPNNDPEVAGVIQQIKELEKQNRLHKFKQLGDFIRKRIESGKSIPEVTQEILATCYQQELKAFSAISASKRSSAKMDDASIIIIKLNT